MRIMVALMVLLVVGRMVPAAGEESMRLALDDALALALTMNPGIAEMDHRVAASEARARLAAAGTRPVVKVRGSVDYWTEDQRLYPATRNAESGAFGPSWGAGELVGVWPLYTGGRVSAEKEAARLNVDAMTESAARSRETLLFQVTSLFYVLLAQNEVVQALDTAVRSMDAQQATIEALVAAEKAARVDLLRAQVRRAELYERLVSERNNRSDYLRAWAAVIGLNAAQAPIPMGVLQYEDVPVCPDSYSCMEKALQQRTDYRAVRAEVAAATAGQRMARAGRRPTLSAQASYGLRWMPNPTDQPDQVEDQIDVARVGLVLEVPLFDGHATRAREAEASARHFAAQERLRQLELQIRYEVETALSGIRTAQERVYASAQGIVQAEESFRIVQEKYDLGAGSMTDVLDAQSALVTAQTSRARALADLAIADARRTLAVGEMRP